MSKFIDKLNKLARFEPAPMGFGLRKAESVKPKIQLVVSVTGDDLGKIADDIALADAIIMPLADSISCAEALQKVSQAKVPWGIRLDDVTEKDMEALVKTECDFVVLTASMPLSTVDGSKMAKIFNVDGSLDESLRALRGLPIEAVMASRAKDGNQLTWQDLLQFQYIAALAGKPILVETPPKLLEGEIKTLWESGIDGIVVTFKGKQAEQLKKLHETINGITFNIPRKREKTEAILPHMNHATPAAKVEEEEPDEDE